MIVSVCGPTEMSVDALLAEVYQRDVYSWVKIYLYFAVLYLELPYLELTSRSLTLIRNEPGGGRN